MPKKTARFPKSSDVTYDPNSTQTIIPYCRLLVDLQNDAKIPVRLVNSYLGGKFDPNEKGWFISPLQLAKAAIRNHNLGRNLCVSCFVLAAAACALFFISIYHLSSIGKSDPVYFSLLMIMNCFMIGGLVLPIGTGLHLMKITKDDQGNAFSRSADFLKSLSRLVELVGIDAVISSNSDKLYQAAYEYCLKKASDILLQKADIAERKKSLIVSGNNEELACDENMLELLTITLKDEHDFFVKTFGIDNLYTPEHFYQKAVKRLEQGQSVFLEENQRSRAQSVETAS